MSIRPAIKDDCAAIAEIYNHAVVHTAAIWNDKTVDTDNRIAWFEARQIAGYGRRCCPVHLLSTWQYRGFGLHKE